MRSLQRTFQIGNKGFSFLYQPEDTEWVEAEITKKINRGLNAGKTVSENGTKKFMIFKELLDKNHKLIWHEDGERVRVEKTLVEIDKDENRTETFEGFLWRKEED